MKNMLDYKDNIFYLKGDYEMNKTKEIKTIQVNLDLLKHTNYYTSVILAYAKEAEKDGRMKTPDGYFMLSNEEVEKKLKFTRYQQNEGFKVLKSMNLLDVELKGFPAFRYVRIK